jgi:hypothetical protein
MKYIFFVLLFLFFTVGVTFASYRLETKAMEPGLSEQKLEIELYLVENKKSSEERTVITSGQLKPDSTVEFEEQYIPEGLLELKVTQGDYVFARRISPEEQEKKSISLNVFPPGAQLDQLNIKRREILIRPGEDNFAVQERIVVENNSRKLFSSRKELFDIALPADATDFLFGPGFFGDSHINLHDNELIYGLSIPPGETELGFNYVVPSSGSSGDLSWKLRRPTKNLTLAVPAYEGLEVGVGENLDRSRQDDLNTHFFRAENLEVGEVISISWEGWKKPAYGSGRGINDQRKMRGAEYWLYRFIFWTAAVMLTFAFVLLGAIFWWMLRKNSEQELPEKFVEQELEKLEQAYKQKMIDKRYYEETRRRWREFIKDR